MKCPATRIASLAHGRGGAPAITSGITELEVLKTTNSAFSGFLRDEYTTLKDAPERIFATTVEATWNCAGNPDYNAAFSAARQAILETFATHESLGVQQTIYAMGQAVLAAVPAITQIAFTLPNQHRILMNLAPFNMTNENEIFITTSEPFGLIKGTITRD
jgi:urate oxidase